ncbi:beta/gamma crystallin domain-containing protein 2 [Nothobranchius furzeri]
METGSDPNICCSTGADPNGLVPTQIQDQVHVLNHTPADVDQNSSDLTCAGPGPVLPGPDEPGPVLPGPAEPGPDEPGPVLPGLTTSLHLHPGSSVLKFSSSDPDWIPTTPDSSRSVSGPAGLGSAGLKEASVLLTESSKAEPVTRHQRTRLASQESGSALRPADHGGPLDLLTERTDPEPATWTPPLRPQNTSADVQKPSGTGAHRQTRPGCEDSVYGVLYESLFPRSFSSEVLTPLLHRPTRPAMRPPASEPEPNSADPPADSRPRLLSHDSATGFSCSGAVELTGSSLDQTSGSPQPEQRPPQTQQRSDRVPDTERIGSRSEPACSGAGASLEAEAQVSQSKHRVVFVKQLVPDVSSSPAGEMTSLDLQERLSGTETSPEPPGLKEGSTRPLSPAYLSVGSDEGSQVEVYFSAQEDDAEDSRDQDTFREDQRRDTCELLGEDGQVDGRDVRRVRDEHQRSRTSREEAGQRSADQLLLRGSSDPDPEPTRTQPGGEGGREELPAPPVQQVNRLMECDSAPPSSKAQEGNWAGETQEPSDGELQPLGPILVSTATRRPRETGGGSTGEGEGLPAAEGDEQASPAVDTSCVLADTRVAGEPGPARPEPGAAPPSREGAGTMTQSSDKDTATLQRAPVQSSTPKLDTAHPDGDAAELHPAEDYSFQSSSAADPEDMMSSGVSSLSTKLTLKASSPPAEDGSKPRVHKVSLVLEGDRSSQPPHADPGSEFRWKNRFEGVTQYKPQRPSYSSSSSSSESFFSLDSSSALPEDTANTPLSSSSSVAPGSSLSDRPGYLSHGGAADEWRRSLVGEELAAPAGEGERRTEEEAERASQWDWQQLPASSCSSDGSSQFSGVFVATLVELVPDPAAVSSSSPPSSPEAESSHLSHMDTLVDTLKSMGPSLRPRSAVLRAPAPVLLSSLPPIVEDAPSSSLLSPPGRPPRSSEEVLNGLYTLPADLGLKRSSSRDSRSPREVIKSSQDTSSPVQNGTGPAQSTSSRLDSSILFSTYRSSSLDQTAEDGTASRPLFRSGSLPETGSLSERLSVALKEPGETGPVPEPTGSRLERLSFLMNSPSSGSLSGSEDSSSTRISLPPSLGISSPPSMNSPTRLLSPTGFMDRHRSSSLPEPPLPTVFLQGPGALQRSLSSEGGAQMSLFSSMHGPAQYQNQQDEPDHCLMSKYRAFPDAYLTKEKEHGKLNPRPGKMYIFDQPGMCGQRFEVRGDVIDATPWELQETISIRVVRGGWVLYEKPDFKGEKIALDEGDIELTCPFEQLQSGQQEENGEPRDEKKSERRFIIGSIRRAVRDYSVPEICLFPEENAEGKKVVFRDTSEDARIFGFPIKANSVIVNAGLWLVFAQPFFQGVPRILEVGGYPSPAAWGVEQPYVGSLHPLKVGEPRVENQAEPKVVIYDKPYFTGKSRTITSNMKDFMTRTDPQQTVFMYNVGSIRVLGGIWVGCEKEGFRGNQYLLEEGEYHDWRVWGGRDSELRSVRIIQADLTDPLMVMFEQPEEEEGVTEENTFEVTEAIPDVELFNYKASTRSIHVLSGAWIAYSHVDYSGNQYILEKGFYNNCADWGSKDTRVCSVQPILLAPTEGVSSRDQIILYSEPDFKGESLRFHHHQGALPDTFTTRSCRVVAGSWVLYENTQFSGDTYVLSEDDYPSLASMGCSSSCSIRSIKLVPMTLSVPSISLFGLEGLEGREITVDTEVVSLVREGFSNHILSVRVNSSSWVLCEHSKYRGRQFFLEPIEITNWPKFSSLQTVGSMFPVRQKRRFFRVKNGESGHFLSVQGGVEEMKSGRVVVSQEVDPSSDVWFYQDGLIKNKMAPTMCLQVMGNVEPAAKVVLWSETRQPIQTWSAEMKGPCSSLTFPGMVLDVKGGRSYDKEHVVVRPESEDSPSQQWEVELL